MDIYDYCLNKYHKQKGYKGKIRQAHNVFERDYAIKENIEPYYNTINIKICPYEIEPPPDSTLKPGFVDDDTPSIIYFNVHTDKPLLGIFFLATEILRQKNISKYFLFYNMLKNVEPIKVEYNIGKKQGLSLEEIPLSFFVENKEMNKAILWYCRFIKSGKEPKINNQTEKELYECLQFLFNAIKGG
jgi:hypothetical protein